MHGNNIEGEKKGEKGTIFLQEREAIARTPQIQFAAQIQGARCCLWRGQNFPGRKLSVRVWWATELVC